MTRAPHLQLPDDLHAAAKAELLAELREAAFLGDDPDDHLPEVDDAFDALFADHDAVRGHGRGAYVFDDAEARSRRIDATPHADRADEPLAMPPAEEGVEAIALAFTG